MFSISSLFNPVKAMIFSIGSPAFFIDLAKVYVL
jgi:hypothetical protein